MKRIALFFFAWVFIATTSLAQNITGDWFGLLDVGAAKLRLAVHVQSGDAGFTATLDSPDQGASGIPLDEFSFDEGAVTFTFAAAGLTYEGQADEGFSAISGTFSQGGQSWPLTFGRTMPEPPEGSPMWSQERLDQQEIYIPMRDGIRLFTSVYTPKDKSKDYPILLWRTPYNSEPGGEASYSGRLGSMVYMINEGYIIAYQDVRGRFMSEGTFEDVRPFNPDKKSSQDIDENSDTYDTIDYLVTNVANNNGRVGILGISYPGFYSTMSLPEAHPALKAVSPQAPVTNWFIGDDWHHNGAFFLLDAFSFYSSVGQPRPEPTRSGPPPFQWQSQDNYDFFIDIGPIKNIAEKYFHDIQFWPELMTHPNYDDFWKARNPLPHLRDIQPAVLTVGGWFDAEDLYGPIHTYEAIEDQNPENPDNRIIMGPWFHGQWAGGDAENMGNVHWGTNTSLYFKDVEKRFFNYFLKDEGELGLAEATMFDTGATEWNEFETWPPAGIEARDLFFQPDGGLSFSAPTATDSFDEYVADPLRPVPYTEDVHLRRTRAYMSDDQRFASRRPDVMVYEMEPLSEAITLAGPVVADLCFSTTGTDADFVVKLIDVFPDSLSGYPANDKNVPMQGYQMLVRGEVLRGRFRNSFESPDGFKPGEVTKVRFEIPDVMHTFKKGHRIMIQVQHSWFPLVDSNPQTFVNIYEADREDFQKATHRIYHDTEWPSHVKVHVLNR